MLMIGIGGKSVLVEEENWLNVPQVSGVILFTRNFDSRQQITELIRSIRSIRPENFLIAVDQEGGPVQRFREGFTNLPALSNFGRIFENDREAALVLAERHAWLMASEMRAIGIDLSFAPVVDLKLGNKAIGERAFHANPAIVAELSVAYVRGMRAAGMAASLKHFPGHGSVLEDTHFDAAVDARELFELKQNDLLPFQICFESGADAVMMAHVTYPLVDNQAAGYSSIWIRDILRAQMQFDGVVISDDVGMAAAESAGGVAARVHAHMDAGCDLVLACHPSIVPDAIAAARSYAPMPLFAYERLRGRGEIDFESLIASSDWKDAQTQVRGVIE